MNFKKPICVALASLTIMSAMSLPVIPSISDSMSISVSAATNTSMSDFLYNARYDSSTKTYNSRYNTCKFEDDRCIWRSGYQISSVKSSNNSIVQIYKKNKGNGKYEYRFKTVATSGKAYITVKYKNTQITDRIKIMISGKSSRDSVTVGKTRTFAYNNSGIKSAKALKNNVSVSHNGKTVIVKGLKTGSVTVRVIYKNNLIEDRVFNVQPYKSPNQLWKEYAAKINVNRNSLGVPTKWNYYEDADYYYFKGGYVSKTDFARLCNCVSHEYGGEPTTFEQAKVVEVIMNLCNSEGRSIQSCIAYPNRFEGSELYRNYTTIMSRVSSNTIAAVQMYFTDPTVFNQGYTCFFGDGRYNYFWQNFNCWTSAWKGNWNMTYTRSDGTKFTIKSKQDYLNKFYGDRVVKTMKPTKK